MRRLVVLGTHNFAPEIYDLASEIPDVTVEAFVENLDRERTRMTIEDLPVLWIEDLGSYVATHLGVCALGTTARSAFTEQAAALGLRYTTLVHPRAHVSSRSTLGEGTVVGAGAVVGTRTRVGSHVIVNRGALVGHDVEIGDHVTIGPGANVAGLCRIGDGAYVSMGAVVLDRTTIGSGALVAAGSVVTRDVPPNTEVRGVPARVVRQDVDGR